MTATERAALDRWRLDVAVGRPVRLLPTDTGFAATAVAFALTHGAPLGPVLDVVGQVLDADRTVRDEMAAALAPVRSVGIALAVLPVVAVPLLGRVVGTDLVGFYTTPTGQGVAVVAAGLWLAGVAGIVAVVRSVRRRSDDLVPLLELAAVGTSAGLPCATALRDAAGVAPGPLRDAVRGLALAADLGRDHVHGAPADVDRRLPELLDALAATGGPPTAALRSLAAQLRAEELAATRQRAARLPTHLTLPTVLGLLPATLLLVGAPLVAAGLASTLS